MNVYYLPKSSFKRLLTCLVESYDIYVLKEFSKNLYYNLLRKDELAGMENIITDKLRAVQPLKSFFHLFAEDVTDLQKQKTGRIIIGAKACDLNALSVMDRMFLEGDYRDGFYADKRDNTVIISGDCSEPDENCFCTLLGNKPYPEKNFDLNVSASYDGYVIEVGSEKGEKLASENKSIFSFEAKRDLTENRDEKRKKVIETITGLNRDNKLKPGFFSDLPAKYDSGEWKKQSEPCVECGACTMACPSCYCFLLAEVPDKNIFTRVKYQDSCQYSGYARVAGGATPRPSLYERFRNRYYCKYEYRPGAIGLVACTGCGRCIAACQGGIDKRKVIAEITGK